MQRIGIIGGGNMGEAIIAGSFKKYFIRVSEQDIVRQKYLKKSYQLHCDDLRTLAKSSEVIILAVKPQDIEGVLKELKNYLTKDKLVISIAAGITTAYIEGLLGGKIRVIRTMPNLPAVIGQATTVICKGRLATQSDVGLAVKIFNNIGKTFLLNEDLIDVVTAVSGSGPAYVFLFMEYLIEAAKSLGLNEGLAGTIVKNTFLGSINLLIQRNENPALLRAKVTSKGGTTQAALDVFYRNKLKQIFLKALRAAKQRAQQLSRV